MFAKIISIFALMAVVSACQHQSVSPPDVVQPTNVTQRWSDDISVFEERMHWFKSMESWQVSAKVALQTNTLREQASIDWQYKEQGNLIRMFGPLGLGAVRVSFNDQGVELQGSDGLIHTGTSAESLMMELTGWPLPINSLAHWLFALPDEGTASEYLLDEQGRLISLRQEGWEIHYSAYREYSGRQLPRKLSAKKQFASHQGGLVTVKFVAKRWSW